MKLGANSVLFGGHSIEAAFKSIAMAGYDGIELSAIDGMSEHLVLDRWEELVPEIRDLSDEYGLELLAMEQPLRDSRRHGSCLPRRVRVGHPGRQLRTRRNFRRRKQLERPRSNRSPRWRRSARNTALRSVSKRTLEPASTTRQPRSG